MSQKNDFFVNPHPKFGGIYLINQETSELIGTKNIDVGTSVYGEKIFKGTADREEYREWNPYRSKLCAYFKKNGKEFPFTPGSVVLYLGAANGTTVSHVSDFLPKGRIYAVEFSARSLRELVQRLANRKNVIPMLADATRPLDYRSLIPEQVDVIYQDVAQPEQAKILIDNARIFLKPGGHFYITIKARSIDVAKDPEVIFQKERALLQRNGCTILDERDIAPFSEDHVMMVGQVE
nr:fibrillarin-like rRNA/tRNA 2'-O-methyltransferase [Candidatus Sigynarchaeota archaeon]